MIARQVKKKLFRLNATTASTADIKEVYASLDTLEGMHGVVLYLDEIQYFNKKQQQTLLEFIEDGRITLIASTTENPYFYIYNAVLSRCTVFEFRPVEPKEMERAVQRGFDFLVQERGEKAALEEGVIEHIALSCGGDVRKAMNAVELCFLSAPWEDGVRRISLEQAQALSQRSAMRYDKDGEEHYDILSAFQKSMRGSDPQAALHYLARLLEAGDLPSACRRLLVCACEDVGLAWPQILPTVKAAVDIALQVGAAGGAHPPGGCGGAGVQRTKIQYGVPGYRPGACRRAGREKPGRSPVRCKISISTAPTARKRDSFTSIRTTFPDGGCRSSTCRIAWQERNIINMGRIKMNRRFKPTGKPSRGGKKVKKLSFFL